MSVAERLRTRERALKPMETAFMVNRLVVGPQPLQQHDVFVEPGKIILVAKTAPPPGGSICTLTRPPLS